MLFRLAKGEARGFAAYLRARHDRAGVRLRIGGVAMMHSPFHLPAKRRHRRSASPTEAEIHRTVVEHLRARAYPDVVWFHVPNDAKRSPGTVKRLQAMGMLPGVSDLILVHRGHVYALELKSATGRATESQMEFASRVNAAGGHAVVCHDVDRALRCLETWGLIR